MIAGLLLLSAAPAEFVAYECQGAANAFVFTYERRGDSLTKVTVAHSGLPRIGSDMGTRWHGRATAEGAYFTFAERAGGISHAGQMWLSATSEADRFRLAWTSAILGGHVTLEDEGAADCRLANANSPVGTQQ